jgi:hypothetical protein
MALASAASALCSRRLCICFGCVRFLVASAAAAAIALIPLHLF